MATARFEFYSTSIMRMVSFQIILPNDLPEAMVKENPHFKRPVKTLFLLHGYSGNCTDWLYGSAVNELAGLYNLAIICPSGENSFYLDSPVTGRKYGTYLGEELLTYVRKTFGLAKEPEDTYIGGLSMGGFGALHTAFDYPDVFSKVFAFSSALIIHNREGMRPGDADGVGLGNYEYYHMIFGDLENLSASKDNPEVQIKRLLSEKKRIPELYLACGTEDFLLEENREFCRFLKENQVKYIYHESAGEHNWRFWNEYLEPAVQWMIS